MKPQAPSWLIAEKALIVPLAKVMHFMFLLPRLLWALTLTRFKITTLLHSLWLLDMLPMSITALFFQSANTSDCHFSLESAISVDL